MTQLGLDNYEEILQRLEVNNLIRCKSVCKSWNSLITSSCFAKSQLNYNLQKKVDNNEIGNTRIIVYSGATSMCKDECFDSRRDECQVVGSSNGLVCISRYHTDFLVVNPSTREVKELRNPPPEFESCSENVFGFGYDSFIDDYKVLIGYRIVPNEGYVFDVLNLKTNVWRSTVLELDYDYVLYGNGILCNGAIHWLSTDQKDKQVIVSFDLSKEVLKEISLPKLDEEWTLGTMKDHLCVFPLSKEESEESEISEESEESEENEEIEIWVMRNDQVTWERKLPPPGYDANKLTMEYIPNRLFLSGHVHIWLLEEGSRPPVLLRSIDYPQRDSHEHIRIFTYSECNYNYDEHVFVKSLISPHVKRPSYTEALVRTKPPNDVISLSTLHL